MVAGLNADGDNFLAVIVVFPAIAVIATALRMWCKAVTMKSGFQSFHADDWAIVATTVTYLGAESAIYWGLFAGNRGMEIGEMTEDLMSAPSLDKLLRIQNYLKSLFIGNTVVTLTIYLAKISVCLLYRRLFSTQPFRKLCFILIVISTMWFIAATVINLVTCIPVDSFWNRLKPGRCINFNTFSLGVGIVDILIDVIILVLPVRAVTSLQLPTRTKAMVSGIFLLGGLAVITNILRVAYQYQPNGFYVNFGRAEIFLNVHAAISILCACLPTYKPLRDLLGKLVSTIRDRYGSSVRFLRSGSGSRSGSSSSWGRARLGSSSKDSTDRGHDLTSQDPSHGHEAKAAFYPPPMVYHYPATANDSASTRELVQPPPPMYWGHQYGAGYGGYDTGVPPQHQVFTIPDGAIGRTTRVDIV